MTSGRREVLLMGAGAALVPLVGAGPAWAATESGQALHIGRDHPLDQGWRFHRGAGAGLEARDIDDSGWRKVDLPHDWSIEDLPAKPGRIGPFDAAAEGGGSTAHTRGGEGWYRKRFRVHDSSTIGSVELLFEGVAGICDVWLNGRQLGNHVYSYTPFAYDLARHLLSGENVIAVRVRNTGRNSRWYTGSGLYRPVRLSAFAERARVSRWGVAASTRRWDGKTAEIHVATRLDAADPVMVLHTRLKDEAGRTAAEAVATASSAVAQVLRLLSPRLWSTSRPSLYTLETELRRGNRVIDRVAEPFGVRIVTMDAKQGLRINGESVRLRGGCVHHDNGLLGAAAFADADERRVLLLKARGFNAVRSAHNPCSRTFREACDRHGLLLIEEAFDTWHTPKVPQDYSAHFKDHWKADIESMVLSARNSPSVIMWSIGNEVPDRNSPEGMEWGWKLANEVRRLDPTRPVTAGIHGFPGRPVKVAAGTARAGFEEQEDYMSTFYLDVPGYNYKLSDIEPDHALSPDRVYYAAESYASDAHDYEELGRRAPFLLGEFVWTAMDYLGEAGLGLPDRLPAGTTMPASRFPVINAYCGDIDLIGGQKPQSLARDVIWGLSALEMAVGQPVPDGYEERLSSWGWTDELPSWSWPGLEERSMTVHLYTSGDRVELRLNGTVLNSRAVLPGDKMRVQVSVPYRPGTLEAIAYRGGAEIGRRRLETVAEPARLGLRPERDRAPADRQGLVYVGVEILDAAGRSVPYAARKVAVAISGPAELIGFGSASPFATGSFQRSEAETYRGRGLLIMRSKGRKGTIRLRATSEGLQPSTMSLQII